MGPGAGFDLDLRCGLPQVREYGKPSHCRGAVTTPRGQCHHVHSGNEHPSLGTVRRLKRVVNIKGIPAGQLLNVPRIVCVTENFRRRAVFSTGGASSEVCTFDLIQRVRYTKFSTLSYM